MFGLGAPELIIILLIVVVLFGARLPKIARSLGQASTEFKKGINEGTDDDPAATGTDEGKKSR